jgi:hypothetical protein
MEHTEILEYMRGDIRRTLEVEGVPQHQQDELIEFHLAHWLATKMSRITYCLLAADTMHGSEHLRSTMWNW